MPLSILMRTSELPLAARPVSCPADVPLSKVTACFQFWPLVAACAPDRLLAETAVQGCRRPTGDLLCVRFSSLLLQVFNLLYTVWLLTSSSATSKAGCLHCSPSQTWVLWWRKSAEPQQGDTHCLLVVLLPLPDHEAELWVSTDTVSHCPVLIPLKSGMALSTAYPFISLKWDQLPTTWPVLFSSTFPPSHLLKNKWPFGKSAIWKHVQLFIIMIKLWSPGETIPWNILCINSFAELSPHPSLILGSVTKCWQPPMLHSFTTLHQNDFNSGSLHSHQHTILFNAHTFTLVSISLLW